MKGYSQDLYILAFDHRGTITKGLLGVEGREPTAEESEKVTELKNIIFDGFLKAKESGIIAGFPAIDFKVNLHDGAYHDVDSSVMAFEIAARAAFREGMAKANPVLLEPMMKVEVITPEEYMGDVIGDLNSRRGQVQEMSTRGNANVIDAMVPLANMFGYVNNLRSLSQGRANYSMQFDHYEQVPSNVAEEVKAKLA